MEFTIEYSMSRTTWGRFIEAYHPVILPAFPFKRNGAWVLTFDICQVVLDSNFVTVWTNDNLDHLYQDNWQILGGRF